MAPTNLKGKVALVTGASSGIGRGCAIAFAEEGCYVAITGRNKEALDTVAALCIEKGISKEKVLVIQADLSNDAECEHVISATIQHFSELDILVNSAGTLMTGGIENLTVENYDSQMNINTRSLFLMTKLAIPYLIKTNGNIVNISSVTGLRAFPGVLAYNMSKAAVDHLTHTVALEVASHGIRVNAVNPGVIVTEAHKRAGMDDETYKKFLEHGKETHAIGRVGQVEEVADAVVFLASDLASFITGVTLPIDGGRSIMCHH